MNAVVSRVYEQIKLLTKEKEDLERQIKQLKKNDEHTKSDMHRIEFKIAMEGMKDADKPTGSLLHELNDLRHDRNTLKNDEQTLKQLNQKLKDINKTIDTYTFWMRRADTDNLAHQADAEKHVFG